MKTAAVFVRHIVCFSVFILTILNANPQTTIIPYGDTWKYLDDGSDQGGEWISATFNDASWNNGVSKLGYGQGGEATIVNAGCTPVSSCTSKYITTYFRKTFSVTGLKNYMNFTMNVIRDDGVVIYINGNRIASDNISATGMNYTTLATSDISGAAETSPVSFTIPACAFSEGTNTIAAEIHQNATNSTDISFNLELTGNPLSGVPNLARGPYLQVGSDTAITLRWRTDIACSGRVSVGPSNGVYTIATVDEACATTEHIVRLTGLTADSKYYYQVSTTDGTTLEGTAANFFTTLPPANTTRKIRITAFGDCGRNSAIYQDQNLANYQNWLATNGIDAPDAWLLLGDNAYNSGTDAEYTTNFFNIYGGNILKNHKMYPSPGNHDYANSTPNKYVRTLPYYANFSMPQNGECGGVASNKQNYYSFDIGNIHFLSLDSYGIESDNTSIETNGISALKTWLDADLAANTKKWIVAYWHHPPYTKASHNSDVEPDLINIRQNFINFLETRGVDLIICGHSHAYERGYLMKNFTGTWSSFDPAVHAISTSSASYTDNSTCPYTYKSSATSHGTVYVVAGSAGASGGTNPGFGTNAMPFAVNDAGIFYFEVQDNRLDAKMLRRNGTIFDQFTIIKDVNNTSNYTIPNGSSQLLSASWPGTYSWNTSETTHSITVTPAPGVNNYTVTDNFGCITDQFTVTVTAALPVSLLDYSANLVNGKVNCNWSTATENNSKEFTIERSSLASGDFQLVGKLAAAGQSTSIRKYLLVDPSPLPGISYYRLSQTDIDGNIRYYDVKRITNKSVSFAVQQIETTENLVLHIKSSLSDVLLLKVFDAAGKTLLIDRITVGPGDNVREIKLRTGNYVWQVSNSYNEKVSRVAFVK